MDIKNGQIKSLQIKDAEISDVLRMLADQFGLNIIISDKVEGKVSVQFNNVSVEEAIDAIVTINGYAYTKKGSVIKVTTPEEVEKEAPITKVFALTNATAEDLVKSLQKVLSPQGTIEVDQRSNALIVTDSPSIINKLQSLIKELDKETPQVMIEAKIVETILGKTENLGIDWTVTATATGTKRPHTFPFHKIREKSFYPKTDATSSDFPSSSGFPYAVKDDFSLGTLNFSQFQAVMEILKSRSNTKILSNPRLTTLNNQEASILVGTRIPIPVYSFNEDTGTYEVTGYDEEQVGVNLKVTPHVSPDGKIKMSLHPEVSSITGYTGPNDERPIIDTREADTQVQIRDGETVVIGGLIKEEKIKTIKKVPLLGDIPLIGLPFRKKDYTSTNTDLLIFVTAHILKRREKTLAEKKIEVKPFFKPLKTIKGK
jgi:type IV pilus secretin PilQ/predicted competence protein